MTDKTRQHRTNRVFKSLHKPLTYLGVERTLFYFICVGAVGAFNLFNSILAGIAVFIGGACFATVPGNYALNLRQLYLLNTNYADLSFLFMILPGEKTNAHLGTEYLAVVETDNSTPYFLNLHTRDVAHTRTERRRSSGVEVHWRSCPGRSYVPRPGSAPRHERGRTLLGQPLRFNCQNGFMIAQWFSKQSSSTRL